MDSHPMLNSKGKLRGDTRPNRVQIVLTAGSVEPDDKWMMMTIIYLSAAPNRLVGPPTVATIGCICYVHFLGVGWGQVGGPKILNLDGPLKFI